MSGSITSCHQQNDDKGAKDVTPYAGTFLLLRHNALFLCFVFGGNACAGNLFCGIILLKDENGFFCRASRFAGWAVFFNSLVFSVSCRCATCLRRALFR